jgi:hypothetical protein
MSDSVVCTCCGVRFSAISEVAAPPDLCPQCHAVRMARDLVVADLADLHPGDNVGTLGSPGRGELWHIETSDGRRFGPLQLTDVLRSLRAGIFSGKSLARRVECEMPIPLAKLFPGIDLPNEPPHFGAASRGPSLPAAHTRYRRPLIHGPDLLLLPEKVIRPVAIESAIWFSLGVWLPFGSPVRSPG